MPTYRLVRTLWLLFLLMVIYPYLPGSDSKFFQGFSLFAGALVTFGSAGAIGNIVAGVLLTYTNAFRLGDVVRIGESMGTIVGKTLLVTRIRTSFNEELTLPNANVLANTVTNFSSNITKGGVALAVPAGIGYDVDRQQVARLMLESAYRTSHILRVPAAVVLQVGLGDYAVQYELLAYTNRPDLFLVTHSELRGNVLDSFNKAGVEIMTPSVVAHRDASKLAIPDRDFVGGRLPGIAVTIGGSNKGIHAENNSEPTPVMKS
jgi:small-conductance mechanosensitive channel